MPPLLVCHHCDTVYRRRVLARGEVARCRRCNAELERHQRLNEDALLALALAAIVVFVQANMWPIVTLGLNGQQVSATLWGTIVAMWHAGFPLVAMLVAATLVFSPLLQLVLLGWLLWFARRGRRAPGFRRAMLALHYLDPWTMSEVFVLGVLVASVKVGLYFDVTPNAGVFAYAALMLLVTVFAGVDLRSLWDLAESPA
jgi:paraquat-inducible protein A